MKDIETAKVENNFEFKDNSVCPLAAHIRKTNPAMERTVPRRVVSFENGIPYGFDFDAQSPDPTSTTRGLLFACYQSSIEKGYQTIQRFWANSATFPDSGAGFDAFMAQPKDNGKLSVNLFKNATDKTGKSLALPSRLVTMKGGEYFFVPSITALTTTLAGKT